MIALVAVLGMVSPWAVVPAIAAPAADEAPSQRVAVLPIDAEGELAAQLGERLVKRLVDGFGEGARALEKREASTCADAACWRTQASKQKATHFVRTKVTVDDRDYDIEAELINGSSGAVLATATRRCEICGHDELGETFDDIATTLRRRLGASGTALPVLVVASTPPGALVTVDGDAVGKTPLELTLSPGPHDVRVSHRGHVAQLHRVMLVEGAREELSLPLVVAPEGYREPREKPGTLRIAGAAATAVGIAGLGVGIGLAVLDESPIRSRCNGDNVDIAGHCKYRYNSLAAGISVAVIGGAALAAGIALLVVDHKRDRKRRVALRPSASGLELRF